MGAFMGLIVPPGFSEPTECTCGPDRFMRRNRIDFVPDHLFGLDIKLACCIHDYMYRIGTTKQERAQADHVFYLNMLWLIDDDDTNWFLTSARKAKAWVYFQAVRLFGKENFWAGKERPGIALPGPFD